MYFKPSVRIDERYDNNPEYESDAQATAGFVTVISPELGLLNSMRNLNIMGAYKAESYSYQRAEELNYVGQSLNLSLASELNRDETVTGNWGITYSEDSLSAAETGIQTQRTKLYSSSLNAAYKRIMDASTSVNAEFTGDIYEFENQTLVDTATTEAKITGQYGLSRDLSAEIGYALAYFMFDGPNASTNTISHTLEGGMNYTVMPDIAVSATLGTAYFVDDDNAFDWVGSMLASKTFRAASVTAKYSRELTHSAGLEEGLNDKDAFSLSLMYQMFSSFSVSVAGSASRYSPIRAGAIDTVSYGGDLRLLYQPISWMSVGAGYSRFHQFEDVEDGAKLNREQAYMTVILHPFEWRLN
ncbi:MAG: hypothetical protein AABZ23_03485 [Deltaproteobacteria bacterium]